MSAKVYFNDTGYQKFSEYISGNRFSKIFILVDSNSHLYCLPVFLRKAVFLTDFEIIEVEPGEENKDISTCSGIWNSLSDLSADRKSLLINLGGGVITDMGGFAALCFKRGISFVNFPTTLLAMVDAAVGGKTGVNLGSLKNQIGIIKPADMVVADTAFLQTLPPAQMRSGLAEMLKHGLIKKEDHWKKLQALSDLTLEDLDDLILESILIKEEIVEQDPLEDGLRKSLNFGHTLGHAIESYFLEDQGKGKLLHGEAVAAGMVLETFISKELLSFPEEKLLEIKEHLISLYGRIPLEEHDIDKIISFLKFDKKNESGRINFVLLKKIGEPVFDCQVPGRVLKEAFRYYID